jgi:hypothetical protein
VVTDVEDIYDNPADEDDDAETIVDVPTAVELLYFRIDDVSGRTVQLAWATAVEIDNMGFKLYRATTDEYARADEVTFVAAKGRGSGATYVYNDTVPSEGDWWYWLVDVDTAGQETVHGPVWAGAEATTLPNRIYLPLVMKQ